MLPFEILKGSCPTSLFGSKGLRIEVSIIFIAVKALQWKLVL
jgi:hypothetical protein